MKANKLVLEFKKQCGLYLEGNVNENFKFFKQEVLIYFKATDTDKKDNDIQVTRLLNILEQDRLKVYNAVKNDQEKTVKSMLKALVEYCIPKTNEIMDHFNFFNRKQKKTNFMYGTQISRND